MAAVQLVWVLAVRAGILVMVCVVCVVVAGERGNSVMQSVWVLQVR